MGEGVYGLHVFCKNRFRNRDKRDGYQKGGGREEGEKGMGNLVSKIVISLHVTDEY